MSQNCCKRLNFNGCLSNNNKLYQTQQFQSETQSQMKQINGVIELQQKIQSQLEQLPQIVQLENKENFDDSNPIKQTQQQCGSQFSKANFLQNTQNQQQSTSFTQAKQMPTLTTQLFKFEQQTQNLKPNSCKYFNQNSYFQKKAQEKTQSLQKKQQIPIQEQLLENYKSPKFDQTIGTENLKSLRKISQYLNKSQSNQASHHSFQNKNNAWLESGQTTSLEDENNLNGQILVKLREVVHELQKKDASQRLEISKLKSKIATLTDENKVLNNRILEQEDKIKKDNNYIDYLDKQISLLQEKSSKVNNTRRSANSYLNTQEKQGNTEIALLKKENEELEEFIKILLLQNCSGQIDNQQYLQEVMQKWKQKLSEKNLQQQPQQAENNTSSPNPNQDDVTNENHQNPKISQDSNKNLEQFLADESISSDHAEKKLEQDVQNQVVVFDGNSEQKVEVKNIDQSKQPCLNVEELLKQIDNKYNFQPQQYQQQQQSEQNETEPVFKNISYSERQKFKPELELCNPKENIIPFNQTAIICLKDEKEKNSQERLFSQTQIIRNEVKNITLDLSSQIKEIERDEIISKIKVQPKEIQNQTSNLDTQKNIPSIKSQLIPQQPKQQIQQQPQSQQQQQQQQQSQQQQEEQKPTTEHEESKISQQEKQIVSNYSCINQNLLERFNDSKKNKELQEEGLVHIGSDLKDQFQSNLFGDDETDRNENQPEQQEKSSSKQQQNECLLEAENRENNNQELEAEQLDALQEDQTVNLDDPVVCNNDIGTLQEKQQFAPLSDINENGGQYYLTEEKAQQILNDLKQKLQKNFSFEPYFEDVNNQKKYENKENIKK